ncbi:hypothetical protein QBC47DRAFT_130700 [Echria macrotheca]|uniref:Uncharacterized protein n=1 Tax=Echria macrotheca TaxID=438768 RepID=A0AAJ0B196_9PEZI|nr:hypothetical protein QBC47DRAFT_130700 [Echria macrotheca]
MEHPSVNLLAQSADPDGLYHRRNHDFPFGKVLRDSFFKSVQWSADGTTLFTSSYANRICSFVLPADLLEPREEPASLRAQGTLVLPEPSSAIAPCPYFALEKPSTQVILTACTDHPIQLHNAFPPSPNPGDDEEATPLPRQPPPLASFNLVKAETEEYLRTASLLWPAPGTHFIAGTTNRIALFDATKTEPVLTVPTIPSTRHIQKGNGIGMRGIVAALAAQVHEQAGVGLVAAGTWTRHMGLYDLQRAGDCVATWSVAGAAAETGIKGMGIMQTLWSPCGRYLIVNERGASGLLIYDIRGTNRLLTHLDGRSGGRTNQRMSCDVYPGTSAVGGFEVWSGDQNGGAMMWEGVGNEGGAISPAWSWQAHQSTVGSAAMHNSGSVLATCSGAWVAADDGSESEESDDDGTKGSSGLPFVVKESTLKVWNIGSNTSATPAAQDES